MTENPGLYLEWNHSAHGQSGVNCLDCHEAKKGDVDGFMHEEALLSIIVTPKDCSKCHETEFEERDGSHHSKAGQILASLDNLLGEVVGGPEAVNAGCRQCHSAEIEIITEGKNKGKPKPGSWPNTGIGRVNPDGSWGSCTACHGRHRFSRAQARTPDTCGKCHVGPDHPQIEVYNESKHGIIYRANIDEMNLDSDKWVAGVDYSAAPTCATCHMSAGPDEGKTHNAGDRIRSRKSDIAKHSRSATRTRSRSCATRTPSPPRRPSPIRSASRWHGFLQTRSPHSMPCCPRPWTSRPSRTSCAPTSRSPWRLSLEASASVPACKLGQ